MEYWSVFYKEAAPLTGLVAAECLAVGLNTIFKAASAKGMSYFVFILYTYFIATLSLLPFAFFSRRSTHLSTVQRSAITRLLILVLIGFMGHICGYNGLEYSSPTLSSAISSLLPAFTFILALLFGMEKLAWKSSSTRAKIIGTIISVAGALTVIFYKGKILVSSPYSRAPKLVHPHDLGSSDLNWVIGGFLFFVQYILYAAWFIVQTQLIKIWKDELVIIFFYYLGMAILSVMACLLAEKEWDAWKPRTDIRLIAVIYSGIMGQAFVTVIHTWGLRLKGPVYVSSFKPLSFVIAALMGVILLGDSLYLGSVVGAIVITIGFYGIIWGKAKEEERRKRSCSIGSLESSSSTPKTPLLQAFN